MTAKRPRATLDATEPRVQREILADTSVERVQTFDHLSARREFADVISVLPKDEADKFQKMLSGSRVARVQELLTQHDVPGAGSGGPPLLAVPGSLYRGGRVCQVQEEMPAPS